MKAGVSVIWMIIVVVVWALAAIFKRKEQDEFELPPELKPRRDEPQPPAARRLEEELRRMLEPAAPPPIIHEATHPAESLRPRMFAPPVATVESEMQLVPPPPEPRLEPKFQHLPGLTESTQRYAEAMTLEQRVTRHMSEVTSHRVGTTSVVRGEIAPEIRESVHAIRTRAGARSAILASIILGPPRALDSF